MRFKLIKKSVFLILIINFLFFISCSKENEIPEIKIYDINGKVKLSNSFKQQKLVYCYLSPECYTCSEFIQNLQKLNIPKNFFIIIFRDYSGFKLKEAQYNKRYFYDLYYDKDNEFPNKFKLGVFIEYPTFVIFEHGKFIKITTNKNEILDNAK